MSGTGPRGGRKQERAALEAIAQSEGHNEPLAAWDWHHYAEKQRGASSTSMAGS